MSASRQNRVVKIVLINCGLLLLIFGVAELAARAFFPEFTNHIHSDDVSLGISMYSSDALLGWRGRAQRAESGPHTADRKMVLVIGDSVTGGYGTAYEDIYWVKLSRMLAASGSGLQFASPLGSGNTLEDSVATLNTILKQGLNIGFILYQFNQNDILILNREALKKADRDTLPYNRLFSRFAKWRYGYANYSVAARVLQHYGGVMIRRRHGSCEERGIDALGQYTWTFGSKAYADEAEALWRDYESRFLDLAKSTKSRGIGFAFFISPILYDVDEDSIHPYLSSYNLDFRCATINPRTRFRRFADANGIMYFDPIDYVREGFRNRVAEGNFTPFFFAADDNHFTPTAGQYVAEYLFMNLRGVLVQ